MKNKKSDNYLYHGEISRLGYDRITDELELRFTDNRDQVKQGICNLYLTTLGGDPHASYRIARALRNYYKVVNIVVPDYCKSAGTLLCVAANNLYMCDRAELGPLDVQIAKGDELDSTMSGLDIMQAFVYISNESNAMFKNITRTIRHELRLKTKVATDVAQHMATEVFKPILSKIDPIMLGQHQRAMRIGMDYAERLNEMSESMKPDGISRLVGAYTDHGFVIDRKEAKDIFNNVFPLPESMEETYNIVRGIKQRIESCLPYNPFPTVLNLDSFLGDGGNPNAHIENEHGIEFQNTAEPREQNDEGSEQDPKREGLGDS